MKQTYIKPQLKKHVTYRHVLLAESTPTIRISNESAGYSEEPQEGQQGGQYWYDDGNAM